MSLIHITNVYKKNPATKQMIISYNNSIISAKKKHG